jgi:putative oxidoreductase
MRIVVGLLFACHGAQKLFGVLGGQQVVMASMFGLAGVIEFVGGLMIAIGFLTGTVAFIASGEMAYAYFTAHMPRGSVPIQNGGELAVLYCFVFLYIAARGAGVWGVDKRTRI